MERRRSKRFNLSSFPQYVSRVQNKMNELKLQSLAHAKKYDRLPPPKRGRSPRVMAAVELSPKRSRPLPRTLSPLKQKPTSGREDSSAKMASEFADKRRGGIGEGQRVLARGETFWSSRRQFPPALAQQLHNAVRGPHLTLPFQRMPGVSVNSLSSGSSSASSNSSTPFPPSPSPITFLTPSKTSISSSEQSPPTQKKRPNNLHSKNKVPSNSLNQLNVSNSSLHKSASVPQLRNRSASKSPLAVSPTSPRPACSPYLMPITRLKPTTRPKRETKSSSSQNGKKRQRKSSYSESSKSLEKYEQPPKKVPMTLQQPIWNPSYSIPNAITVTPVLPAIATAEGTHTLGADIAFTNNVDPLLLVLDSNLSTAPCLTIPTIMIRSATPIKSPSEEESLVSLCEKFVFRAELAQELDQLKNDLKDIAETNDALSNDT